MSQTLILTLTWPSTLTFVLGNLEFVIGVHFVD